jgi:hypothetical protein
MLVLLQLLGEQQRVELARSAIEDGLSSDLRGLVAGPVMEVDLKGAPSLFLERCA